MELLLFLGLFAILFILGAYALGSGVAGWVLSPLKKQDEDV